LKQPRKIHFCKFAVLIILAIKKKNPFSASAFPTRLLRFADRPNPQKQDAFKKVASGRFGGKIDDQKV